MSSSSRTTSKGGKGAKADKSHKSDGGKGGGDKLYNKEASSKNDDGIIRDKVQQLIEMTQRSEEQVCLALQVHDYDMAVAINMLLEEEESKWETRDKKKKKRQASVSKQDKGGEEGAVVEEWSENGTPAAAGNNTAGGGDKERGRSGRGGGAPRYGRNSDGNRGWRGRERNDNEGNLEDGGGGRGGERRGRPGGPTRGGGGRGRGGGRAGGRYPPRGNRSGGGPRGDSNYNRQPIDTWDNTWDNSTAAAAAAAAATTNHNATDEWDDFTGVDEWSAEEYSLVETKVFTPSVQPSLDSFPEAAQTTLDPNLSLNQDNSYGQQLSQSLQLNQQTVQMPSQSPVPPMVGTLTAAQTQYFSQLSQQNSDGLNKQYGSVAGYQNQTYEKSPVTQVYNSTSPQMYNSSSTQQVYNAGSQQSYNSSQQYSGTPTNAYNNSNYQNSGYGTTQDPQPANQPARTKTQRARVPPPSKIPSSAVEMPGGDLNSGMTYLDVQFGALDMMDNSFDSASSDVKYGASGGAPNTGSTVLDNTSGSGSNALDLGSGASAQNATGLDAYSTSKNTQSSISSSLSQSLSNSESIPQTSEHLSRAYSVPTSVSDRASSQSSGVTTSSSAPSAPSGLDLTKQQSDAHSYGSQSTTYNSYQSKANTYNSSPYSTTQTTANSYGMTNQASTYVNNQSANSYNTASAGSYPNTYSGTTSYQSSANACFPSITQANSYQTNQSYPQNTSQSVYGANTGLNSSNFGSTATSQYNSYSSSASNKLGKENSYDNSSSVVSTQNTTSNSNIASTTSLSLSQSTISNSKTTASLAKSNSAVSNIPPGVTPVMSTPYIMGQVPYFQQPAVYSYEDMQLLQQRLPHMTTPYYDMGYQTPTTLAAVRGDPTGALGGGVGYSTMSADARFATAAAARGDSNTSPVPSSTLTAGAQSQTSTLTAQQGHQPQPILAAGAGQPYFFTTFNPIPAAANYAQFGAMYTLPAATNAHGSSNSNQYPKPATYGSASGYSPYDAIGQSTQDYAKGGYAVSNAAAVAVVTQQAQKAGQGNSSTGGSAGNDLSAMYSKSHAALGKVNSYDKQGFHSGTPPPFTGTLHGSQGAGLPSGTGYAPQVYIPTMAPQHHTTAMMHQPLHQMDVRHQGRRVDSSNSSGQRSQGSNQGKAGSKQPYQTSYWNQN